MKNYVTILDRKDLTAISSFQKALLLTIQNNSNNTYTFLANMEGSKVSLTDWSNDITGMVNSMTSFYGAMTHINITTSEPYTVITPYVLGDKICDYLIIHSNIQLPDVIDLQQFKTSVLPVIKATSLINLYAKSTTILPNKEKYIELLNSIMNTIKCSSRQFKGLVIIGVEKDKVHVSFTSDIERFLSSVFSTANGDDISFGESKPSSLIHKGNKPFTYYLFGLNSDSASNFGTATSLTVSEFLNLNDLGDITPLTSNEVYTDITPNIVNLLAKYTDEIHSIRVSSHPLD